MKGKKKEKRPDSELVPELMTWSHFTTKKTVVLEGWLFGNGTGWCVGSESYGLACSCSTDQK